MDVQRYLENRQKQIEQTPKYRVLCYKCVQPDYSCYCADLKPFDPKISFVILIHPIEVQRRIATGRMSHLCLKDSHLIMGQDYSDNGQVNRLLQDPSYESVVLYPGVRSKNLSHLNGIQRQQVFDSNKKLRIFVIDGTWNTARSMMNQSQNLKDLPRICFDPPGPSNFRVRKQPREGCYSTIEAIHHTIELIGESQGFALETKAHNNLIEVFTKMIDQQVEFTQNSTRRYRSRKRL